MKKVLLITYHFPPDAAVGAVRMAKFAKYLPEHGWEPVVLTVKEKYYDLLDSSAPDIEGSSLRVMRTAMFRNPSYYYRKLKKGLHLDRSNSDGSRSLGSGKTGNSRMSLRRWVNFLLSFPDEYAGWLPFALIKGIKLIRKEDITILMTSGPPHSVHLIGAYLSQWTGIPWIADFRDPWLDNCVSTIEFQNGRIPRLAQWLERRLISRSSLVLTTTQRFTEQLGMRYPSSHEKFVTISNGYDPDEFSNIPFEKEKRFTISYLGSFYHHRNPEPILRAVAELIGGKQIDADRVILRFIGGCGEAEGRAIHALIHQLGLTDAVEILPWSPRQHALEMMVRSHVLLLLAEDQPLQIPGKVYDYLGAGSDILAMTGDGATADLLREIRRGFVVSPGDRPALKTTIKKLYNEYLNARPDDKECFFVGTVPPDKYSRRQLTGELSKLLEKVGATCGKKPS